MPIISRGAFMRLNPFYHFFNKFQHRWKGSLLHKKDSIPPFFMLDLPLTNEEIVFNGKKYTLKKHHLSVYEEFDPNNPVKTPIHYTAECTDGTMIHVHYDKEGKYQFSSISDTTFFNALSKEEKKQLRGEFKKLGDQYSKTIIKEWISALAKPEQAAEIKKNRTLDILNKASITSTTDTAYKKILAETILAFEDHENLTGELFGVKKLLVEYQKLLNESASNKSVKFSMPESKEEKESVSIPVDDMPSTHSEVKTEKSAPKKSDINQDLSEYFTKEKNKLVLKLREQHNSRQEILKIFQSLEANLTKEEHYEMLVKACIAGDKLLIRKHFKYIGGLIDIEDKLAHLLPTCVLHKNMAAFDEVYRNLNSPQLQRTFCNPFVSYPDKFDMQSISLLEIAIHNNDIEFFKKLLDDYNYSPEVTTLTANLVFLTCLQSKHEFLEALLEAGANPSLKIKEIEYNQIVTSEEGMKRLESDRQRIQSTMGDYSPLAIAVQFKDIKTAEILLKYGALVNDKCRFYNKEEKTALYFACQMGQGQLAMVNILLKAGADPFLKTRVTVSDMELELSSLFIAILNQKLEVVDAILSHVKNTIKFEDISVVYNQCKLLNQSIPHSILKVYAVAAHKQAKELMQEDLASETASEMFELAEQFYRDVLNPDEKVIDVKKSDNRIVLLNLASCLDAYGKNLEARGKIAEAIEKFSESLNIRKLHGNPVTIQETIAEMEGKIAQLKKAVLPNSLCKTSLLPV